MKILFVCLGNICRSPLAEIVFSHLVDQENLQSSIFVDSAGTADYHEGQTVDPRTIKTAKRHGLTITHRARQIQPQDFKNFDLIIALDSSNYRNLKAQAKSFQSKIHLFREWDSCGNGDIPDPYYGDEGDFETVFHLCERSGQGLLHHVKANLKENL
jgi:protein-tyrosine phosphatase